MFRALYRRLRKTKRQRERASAAEEVPTLIHFQAQPDKADTEAEPLEMLATGSSQEQPIDSVEVGTTTDSTSTTTLSAASVSWPEQVADPIQLRVLAGRQQLAQLLMSLCSESGGDGEANQVVMELLDSCVSTSQPVSPPLTLPVPSPPAPNSAIERVSQKLLGVLCDRTLAEAGIATGNERWSCFKCVIQNYTKIYAARRFIENLPALGQTRQVNNVLARVAANEVLQIPDLLRQLWASLDKMEFFNEDTAFKAYLEARRNPQARILRELMLTRISRVFLCVVSSNMFLGFTEQELLHILQHCYLSVNSEIEIFLAVVLWLEHNWPHCSLCVERLLSKVRFGLMPTWYLSTIDRANRSQHFTRVVSMPGVQRMIAQGMEDAVTLKNKHRNPHTTVQIEKEGPKKEEPLEETTLPRDWIADTECRHHHKCHCEHFVYPTYDVFKEYLARIVCCAPSYWRTFRPAKEVYRSNFRCCSQRR